MPSQRWKPASSPAVTNRSTRRSRTCSLTGRSSCSIAARAARSPAVYCSLRSHAALVPVPDGAERCVERVVVDDVAGFGVLDGPRPEGGPRPGRRRLGR